MGHVSLVIPVTESNSPVARNRRTRVTAAIMMAIGLFSFFVFGLGTHAGSHSQFTFDPLNSTNAPWHLAALTVLDALDKHRAQDSS